MRKHSSNSKLGKKAVETGPAKAAAPPEVKPPAAEAAGGDPTVLTMQERRAFLARVVRACATEVDASPDLVQEYRSTDKGEVIKLPDKLRALEMDARLAGELGGKGAAKVKAQDAVMDSDLQGALAMIREVTHGRAGDRDLNAGTGDLFPRAFC